jgi:DNA repair protein RecO
MYQIHTTPGFIIDSKPYGEAGKLLSIFTRDLGLVTATAQGIRFEKSKLRYHAQDYSMGMFSLVRGKEFWRLTSAASDSGNSAVGDLKIGNSKGQSELIARLAFLLKRFLNGEERHSELFEVVESGLDFLKKENGNLKGEELKTLESVLVLRILDQLGYIGNIGHLSSIEGEIKTSPLSLKLLQDAAANRSRLNQHINQALKESHL